MTVSFSSLTTMLKEADNWAISFGSLSLLSRKIAATINWALFYSSAR